MKKLINLQETIKKQSTQIAKLNLSPKKDSKSKRQQIHNYLLQGKGLTKVDCIRMFNYINLGDYVYVLRKKFGSGYIDTKKRVNSSTGAKYAFYSINKNYLV